MLLRDKAPKARYKATLDQETSMWRYVSRLASCSQPIEMEVIKNQRRLISQSRRSNAHAEYPPCTRPFARCKVVLPDAKKSENDVVVFLDQTSACECEQEAQQRAAVAALHRIAGNRSLERTLPPQYVESRHDSFNGHIS